MVLFFLFWTPAGEIAVTVLPILSARRFRVKNGRHDVQVFSVLLDQMS